MKELATITALIIIPGMIFAQDTITLQKCRGLALEHNHRMKTAKSHAQAADELKKAAFAQYFPNFSINGTYTYINKDFQLLKEDLLLPVIPYTALDPVTGKFSQAALRDPAVAGSTFVVNPSTGQVVTGPNGDPVFQKYAYLPASATKIDIGNAYLVNGGITQPVYTGGKIRQANRIASYVSDIADHEISLAEDDLLYQVEETYWRTVSLKEKVQLAEKYTGMLKRLVDDLTNIRSEGIITDNDLLKARLKENEANLMLLRARNGMELSKMSLCQMTGLIYSQSLVFADSLNNKGNNAGQYLVTEAEIDGREELRILEKNVQIAEAGEKLMLSRYLPDIAMSAGYNLMNPNPYRGLANEIGSDYTVGLVFSVPIFHFGDKRHTLNAARSEHDAAQSRLDETRELLVLQLQQAVYRYNESAMKTEYAQLAFEQAEQNLRYTEDNFREGILKTTDLLEAQVLWQKAWSELIDARTEQQLSYSNLKKTTGKKQ